MTAWLVLAAMTAGEWSLTLDRLNEPVSGVQSMAVADDGQVYLLASRERRIVRLSPGGEELGAFAGRGEGPGELYGPVRLHYDPRQQLVMAADGGKRKLVCFRRDGSFSHETVWQGVELLGLFLSDTLLAYADASFSPQRPNRGARVYLKRNGEKTGRLLATLGPDRQEDPQQVPGVNNRLWFPWAKRVLLARSPDGARVFVGSTAELAFQAVDAATGREVGMVRDAAPRPRLNQEEIDAHLAKMKDFGRIYNRRHFKNPEFKPPVKSIQVDNLGRLWVALQAAMDDEWAIWRVYEPGDGKVGEVHLPAAFRWGGADDRWLWGWRRDRETDEIVIQKRAYLWK